MSEPLLDAATGYPIPEHIRHLWESTTPIQRMLFDLHVIGAALKAAHTANDPQYGEVNLEDAMACCKQLQAQLTRALPYAVCPLCQGKLSASCLLCKGRGAISKFLWDSPVVTQGIKKLRSHLNK